MKSKTLLTLACGSLASAAFAGEAPASQTPPTPNQQLFDPFAVKSDDGVAVYADFLVWKTFADGLEYAINNKNGTTTASHAHLDSPHSSWSYGYRVGLDYRIPHDNWDINTRYTYFHGDLEAHTAAPQNGALFTNWQFPTAASTYATQARAHWTCNLNTADLELGRNCKAGNWLSIRPYMGVKGVVLQQRYHVKYEGGTAVPAGDEDKIRMFNDFWGVGVRFGFNSLWGLGKGFSIYADGAGSLLSGHFKVQEVEHFEVSDTTVFSVRDNISTVVPVAEIALGFQWDHFFHNDRLHFGVKLGWEFNYYFNQNRYFRFLSSSNLGSFSQNNNDLGFSGLTLGFRFDF